MSDSYIRSSAFTLQQAIDFGEYEPKSLAIFPEWNSLPKGMQFELIKKGLDRKRKILLDQWATVANTLDFSKKPHLQETLDNITKHLDKVVSDKERLYVEYSKL